MWKCDIAIASPKDDGWHLKGTKGRRMIANVPILIMNWGGELVSFFIRSCAGLKEEILGSFAS